jgi:hypothetical protein
VNAWPDRDEKLGHWEEAFTANVTNPDGVPEQKLTSRVIDQATERRTT